MGVAVYSGWQIADSNFLFAAFVGLLLVIVMVEWWGWLTTEASICIFLIAGYVLGNRGFAQIMPLGGLPVPIGELGLALAAGLVVARHTTTRGLPVRWDAISLTMLLWGLLGTGRLVLDVRSFGFYALRDFATVYYCAFYFLLLIIGADAVARSRLRHCLVLVFGLLPVMAAIVEQFPVFFLTQLTFRGAPVFFYKGDLLATFLCSGFFLLALWSRHQPAPLRLAGRTLAIFSLGFGLYLLSRAALLGLVVGLIGCAAAGRWMVLRVAGLTVLLGLLLAVGDAAFLQTDFKQSRIYAAYEHVVSIADFSGSRSYSGDMSLDTGDNNRFRMVWWMSIVRETITGSPLFGLGFGYDLAAGFIRAYDLEMGDDFTARSPHSIVLTVFGRMGLLGAALWVWFMILAARRSWQLARTCDRVDPDADEALSYHAAAWVILISACFGVVLEGPMGAVVFWSLLGLAHVVQNPDGSITSASSKSEDSGEKS